MNLAEYARYDAVGLAELVTKREVTSKELADLALTGVDAVNPYVNAVIETYPERAELNHLAALHGGPLKGVPLLNKDLSFPEKGKLMEMGSQIMAGNISTHDAVSVERLRAAGLNILGRTTTPEFGLVGVTECRTTGITRNPWDLDTTPSGSSGGSAAAVAAGIVPVATASDGGGSIRGPAANCGLIGLKTTRGRVSLAPDWVDELSGLGVVFALTKTVRDTAVLLDCMQGHCPGDPPWPIPPCRPYSQEIDKPLKPLKIAYSASLWGHETVDQEVVRCLANTMQQLEGQGHQIEEAIPRLSYEPFLDATLKIWAGNLATSLGNSSRCQMRKPSHKSLQSSTMAMLVYGNAMTAADLISAFRHFYAVNHEVGRFFDRFDLLVTPCSAALPQKIGEFNCDPVGEIDIETWNREIYKNDSFYPLYNTTGQPAISLPLGRSRHDLPIGIQFAAKTGNEALLLRVARFFEQAMPWFDHRPAVHVGNR